MKTTSLLAAVELLRQSLATSLKMEIPLYMVHVLLMIINEPGITSPKLAERSGLAQATLSRCTQILGKGIRKGNSNVREPGLELIVHDELATDARVKTFSPTVKGEELAKLIKAI